MAGLEQFNPEQAAQSLTEQFIPRVSALGLSEEDFQLHLNIVQEFNKIAASMVVEEPGIALPGSDQMVPFDEKMAMQALTLFAEGIFHAMQKGLEMRLVNEVKTPLLQNLAMDIYNQAKQIVVSTYGQEHTPEFQISHAQQVDFMGQASENALMFYIAEYEKQNGPIPLIEFDENEPAPQMAVPPLAAPAMADPLPVAPMAAAPKPAGPTLHDKYAAVALLLTALPADRRASVLKSFNQEERELVSFYSYPEHIEQNLDIQCVNQHLKQFKEILKQGTPGLQSLAYRGIAKLASAFPAQHLLTWIQDERPVVKQYVEMHLACADELESEESPLSQLPPKIEEVLHRYLAQQAESAKRPNGSIMSA